MVQRYKLRLSDGTVLLVDHDGLSTWLVDAQAKVQLIGSSQWRPLKEFLAQERRAARRAERERPSDRAALPLVYPEPKKAEEPVPLADPAPPTEAVDTSSIGAPESIQAFADDPLLSEKAPAPRPSMPDVVVPASLPNIIVEDEGPQVPAGPPSVDSEPLRLGGPVGVPARADDPAAPAEAFVPRPPPPDELARPSLPEPSVEDEFPTGAPPVVPESPLIEPAGVLARADDPLAPAAAFVPRPPTPDEVGPVSSPVPPVEDEGPRLMPDSPSRAPEPPRVGEPVGVRALADDPVAPSAASAPPLSTAYDDVPVIPLKPLESPDELPVIPFKRLDARDEAPRPRATRSRTDFEEDYIAERMFRPGGLGESLLRAVSGFGAFLSRLLDPISRLERGLPPIPPGRPEARRAAVSSPEPSPGAPLAGGPMEVGVLADEVSAPVAAEPHRRSAAEDRLPIIPLKPFDDDGAPSAVALRLRLLWTRASAWIDGATAPFGRLVQREAPPPPRPPDEWAPSRAPEPPPREPLVAPPSANELPTLRFAKTHESKEVEDLYEDDESVGFVAVGWLWIRRLVLVTVLVAGGILAAKNWETWFPRAGELGNTMFVEVDERVRSFDVSERQMQAVQEAVERLPHLSSETIRLVMADSPAGVLDPPEVFGVACDASDRGLSALPPREVEELGELRVALLDTLRPSERQRVREYDRARARGVVFPYEHRVVLALVARGARALSPESRVRMQALSGKAVAAGLTLPIDVEAPAAEP